MKPQSFPAIVHGYFLDYLPQQRGLQPSSICSYRDTLRLFLIFVAKQRHRGVSDLSIEHMDYQSVLAFLRDMEKERGNAIATRNQRLAALHTFYEYIVRNIPEMLPFCAKVAAIPMKRCPQPEMKFLAREDVEALFARIPSDGRLSIRDRALFMLLYNTGARVSEVAQLTIGQVDLKSPAQVRLLGKGAKWRACPLWDQTTKALRKMLHERPRNLASTDPVFVGNGGEPMTRFGIYKRIRHHAQAWEVSTNSSSRIRVTPHVFRHTTAVHLLEAGVEVNVIRGWLGHVSLNTTNRYAEITVRMKADALALCEPIEENVGRTRKSAWQGDAGMLAWLSSL